jgi:hypothetical protein
MIHHLWPGGGAFLGVPHGLNRDGGGYRPTGSAVGLQQRGTGGAAFAGRSTAAKPPLSYQDAVGRAELGD